MPSNTESAAHVRSQYTIRRYTVADHPALLLFLAATWAELGRQFLPEAKDSDLLNIDRIYLDGRGSFYVAEFKQQLVGSAALRYFADGVAELKRVYVSAAHRRMGLAERLCTVAIADAEALKYQYVRLDTTKGSTAAVALFRKLGFKDIPRYNADGFADVFMEKVL
jgi:putative acetyltransferase